MEKVSVHPARHYYPSRELATTVRGVHGYQADCTCGWKGEVREKHGVARFDAQCHRHEAHALPWESADAAPPAGASD